MVTTTFLAVEGEAGNPLFPASYDIIWSIVCLAVILVAFWKYVLPMIQKTLDERTDTIEGGIARAEAAQVEAKAALDKYNAQLAEARGEAARIRDDARAQGEQIKAEMRAQAQEESNRITAAGQAQLAAMRQQVVTELRADLGRTAVDLAERVIGESLADDARRSGTVDRFLDELDAMSTSTSDRRGSASDVPTAGV